MKHINRKTAKISNEAAVNTKVKPLLYNRAVQQQTVMLVTDLRNKLCLTSLNELIFDVPKYKLETCGQNAFTAAVPTLWSRLPSEIKISQSLNFFKRVKTLLFTPAFSCQYTLHV